MRSVNWTIQEHLVLLLLMTDRTITKDGLVTKRHDCRQKMLHAVFSSGIVFLSGTMLLNIYHTSSSSTDQQPWKEYFLEFIMIFLAVTLGFFAETVRERLSENSKAKELAE